MSKSNIVLFFLLFVTLGLSQNKVNLDSILKKSEHFYKAQSHFYYKTVYKLYTTPSSNEVAEEDYGELIGHNGIIYQKMYANENIDFEEKKMIIDNDNKIVAIQKKETNDVLFGIKNYFNQYSKKQIIKNDNYWILELYNPVDLFVKYYKVRIYFYKKDGSIYKQGLYSKGQSSVNKKGKKLIIKDPRLEIYFRKEKYTNEQAKKVDLSYYFTKNSEGKIILKNKIANYKLLQN
ncbi:MAG: hypothetical protein HC854_11380 [Flavobacterium sp.]|nr:hypothetical protein [Flavobacterium sp.]